jgi:hypothetical protein
MKLFTLTDAATKATYNPLQPGLARLNRTLSAHLCRGAFGDFEDTRFTLHPGELKTRFRYPAKLARGILVTSDHRVAGSSPAGCKTSIRADLQAIKQPEKRNFQSSECP